VVPALSTYYYPRKRYLKAYAVGVLGYAVGLVVSAVADLPSGAMIVCAIVAIGAVLAALGRRRAAA